jgi:membrane-bound serine protease (ClpP class)
MLRRVPRLLPLALLLALPAPAHARSDAPTVTIVQISGGLDSAYAGFLRGEIHRAERRHDLAVVLRLNSSGTVKADGVALANVVRDSTVPVATWVGPRGAHVAGAATLVWQAGDVRLVAPGAEVRPADPLSVGGPGGTGAPAVRANALLEQHLADGAAGTLVEAVRTLDGRTAGGRTLAIDPAVVDIRFARPGPVVAVRHALATNPTLVYLLLLTGLGAIVFEAFQPGFGPAGYAGGLLVLLAAYGLAALPTYPVGLALLLAGAGGMALDVRRDALGPPTWLGTALLAAGSWWLVHTHGPALRPALWSIVVGVLGSVVFYGVVMTVVLRALRGQTGQLGRALVGRSGEVRSTLNPQGHVLVEGALWRAQALEWDGPVAAGTPVRVTGVDEAALLLEVEPIAGKG